ncbi:MAG: stage II sporulation protein D [Clostridia bacterium]|nr:stage II sporulation protein D [Clostridia bacterium]
MRKLMYYTCLMLVVVIIMPLIIVKGCSSSLPEEDYTLPGEEKAIKIKVYTHNEDKVEEMYLEEYIKGVVVAEMPADFELEALKAQAVAARTYAVGRMMKLYKPKEDLHNGADICTDPAHCQAWISKEKAMKKWSFFSGLKNWKKIEKSVAETRNIVITYDGKVINPLFHSNSGGRTENAEEVWAGTGSPYLKSVPSKGEDASSEYKVTKTITVEEFISKLENEYKDSKIKEKDILEQIKVVDYTEGGRVKNIKIGNITLKGTDIRRIFSLRSANFKIEEGDKGKINITTIGNGHGVGMSQWGSNHLAKNEATYEEILKYYYSGVKLGTINTKKEK